MSAKVPSVRLNNGVEMPVIGFGVWKLFDSAECEAAVLAALAAGYRRIDTATLYRNEAAVGTAIKRSGIPRSELFITTKAWIHQLGYKETREACLRSLERLQTDYIDLYLVHQPYGDVYGAWRAMIELLHEGKVRAIGVSNFAPDRIEDLSRAFGIVPALNQIECHPLWQRKSDVRYAQQKGIVVEAWRPLCFGRETLLRQETLQKIAEKHGKSPAQVALRWNIQRGVLVAVKAAGADHVKDNINIFDFELSPEEMELMASLDMNKPLFHDYSDPAYVASLYDAIEKEGASSARSSEQDGCSELDE